MTELRFTVFGKPEPQGSMRAFLPKGSTRPIVTSDNAKMKPYRQMVSQTAMLECKSEMPLFGPQSPVQLSVDFYLRQPSSGKAKSRKWPSVRPDTDKLCRCILDALTGIVYADDSQVVGLMAFKHYDAVERTEISVRGLV